MGFLRKCFGNILVDSREESFVLVVSTETDDPSEDVEIPYSEFQNLQAALGDLQINDKQFKEWMDKNLLFVPVVEKGKCRANHEDWKMTGALYCLFCGAKL